MYSLRCIYLFVLFLFFIESSYAASNVALHAQAIYSPEPRYVHTKSLNDSYKLTDGRFAHGHFWTSRANTVGWQQSGLIRIDFDLHQQNILERVIISTARGVRSGVSFPARVDVYFSQNARDYQYGGNILEGQDLSDGPYLVEKFSSDLSAATARYVTFFIVPQGKFVFLDEIEILGRPGHEATSDYPIPKGKLSDFQKDILTLGHEQKVWNFLKTRLNSGKSDSLYVGESDKSQLFALNAVRINTAVPSAGGVIWSSNPWTTFTPVDAPFGQEIFPELNFHVLDGGVSIRTLNVVSTLDHVAMGKVFLTWNHPTVAGPEVEIYECLPVPTRSGKLVGDPLIPIGEKIVFTPGEGRQFFLVTRGGLPGMYSGTLRVDFSSGQKMQVPLHVQVYTARLSKIDLPMANAWAYLTWRQIKNIPQKALNDLQQHHLNIGIAHPRQIPFPGQGKLQQVEEFKRAISLQKDKKNILLFFNLRDQNILNKFGNYQNRNAWNSRLKQCLTEVCSLSQKVGCDPERLLFYPVDEPQNSEHVEKIVNFSTVLKEISPTLRMYTTVDRISRLSGGDFSMLAESCDVVQVKEEDLLSPGVDYLRSMRTEIWVYSTAGGKEASPMGLYRLMAWRAFRGRASGIGFWAYADIGPQGTVWDDTDGARADYSVIYVENQEILSSKRWEAWRAGCEDYALLQSVERKLDKLDNVIMNYKEFYDGIDYIIANPDDYIFFEAFRVKLLRIISN